MSKSLLHLEGNIAVAVPELRGNGIKKVVAEVTEGTFGILQHELILQFDNKVAGDLAGVLGFSFDRVPIEGMTAFPRTQNLAFHGKPLVENTDGKSVKNFGIRVEIFER